GSSPTSSSISVSSDYPLPFEGASITYRYGNGVPGCPVKTVTKLVKCPFSLATPFFSINAFDNNGDFRFHLFADVYNELVPGANNNTEIRWKIKYNLGTDTFNA